MKPLPGQSSVIQPRLSLEFHVESRLEMLDIPHIHDHVVRVFKEMIATQWDVKLTRNLMLW